MKEVKNSRCLWGLEGHLLTPAKDDLNEETQEAFKILPPQGFILFPESITSIEQLQKLTNNLKSLYGHSITISIDWEGGRVDRMASAGITPRMPAAGDFNQFYYLLAEIFSEIQHQACNALFIIGNVQIPKTEVLNQLIDIRNIMRDKQQIAINRTKDIESSKNSLASIIPQKINQIPTLIKDIIKFTNIFTNPLNTVVNYLSSNNYDVGKVTEELKKTLEIDCDYEALNIASQAVLNNFRAIGSILKMIGCNNDLAPVADLYYPFADEVIGDRSFHYSKTTIDDETKEIDEKEIFKVASFCFSAILGLHQNGISACLKHAPGHGRARGDSHKGLYTIDTSLQKLEETDFKVFKYIVQLCKEEGIHIKLMTAHLKFLALDETNPITLSSNGINYLKNDISQGSAAIISDCLLMQALYTDNDADWLDQKDTIKGQIRKSLREGQISPSKTIKDLQYELLSKELGEDNVNEMDQKSATQIAKNAIKAFQAGCDSCIISSATVEQIGLINQTLFDYYKSLGEEMHDDFIA